MYNINPEIKENPQNEKQAGANEKSDGEAVLPCL
jgi:hypothetical protein